MNKAQKDLLDIIVHDIGETVLRVNEDGENSYYVGNLTIPTVDNPIVSIKGVIMTSFFKEGLVRLSKDQMITELTKYLADANEMNIQTSANAQWFKYSKG